MSDRPYGTLVLIGRFQPLHNAHLEIIRRCTALTDQLVIIVGSANQPRTYKNPFSFEERKRMILEASRNLNLRVYVEPNTDTIYNDQAWAVRVQGIHSKYRCLGLKDGIIGHKKDESSFYLDMFPQWEFVNVDKIEPLGATDIRDLYFRRDANMSFIKGVVPRTTFEWLESFGLPYPPVFVTTDTVVIQSGHVLMIKRRSEPGKGLWALPGGFLNANTDKSVEDAAIRELREETGIKVPAPVLRGSIVRSRVFDAIDRSARGRTITHAYHIVLPDGELPRVKGQDDAEKARWVPIAEVKSEECFEDHYEIIQHFLGA